MCGVGGKKDLALQHLEPGTSLGRWAERNLYQCWKDAQDVGTNSPGDCLGLEVATEKGFPLASEDWTSLQVPARRGWTSSDPFLGQRLSGVR